SCPLPIPSIMPSSTATAERPWACQFCDRQPYTREGDLLRHIDSHHPHQSTEHHTGLAEEARQRKWRNESPLPPAQSPSERTITRNAEQEAYFFQARAAKATRSKPYDMADPLVDDSSGTTETYLPHHLKSRTGRITLGPRRNRQSTVIVKHPLAWEAEQYEDVPDYEI